MLEGLYVPNLTAFNQDGSVDYSATIDHAKWLISQGVSGLVPYGTFGEGSSLSLSERLSLTQKLITSQPLIEIIPTMISNSFGEISEFLDTINDLPISAVMVMPPNYFRPIPDASLIDFYNRLVDMTHHPIIAYNLPVCSLTIPSEVLKKSRVWGIKDSSGEIESTNAFLSTGKSVFVGSEAMLIKAVRLGARGGIAGIANFFPSQMVDVYQKSLLGAHEAADILLTQILEAIKQLIGSDPGVIQGIGTLKSITGLFGPVSMGLMRYPLPSFTAPQENTEKFLELSRALIS